MQTEKNKPYTDPKDLEWLNSVSDEWLLEHSHEPIVYENIDDDPTNINMDENELAEWIKENGLIDATSFFDRLRNL